jgi:hypothetical protein
MEVIGFMGHGPYQRYLILFIIFGGNY